MRIVEVRLGALLGVEVEDDDTFDPDEFLGEVRAWISQYGEVRDLSYADSDAPKQGQAAEPKKPKAPARPPFRRPPPKIFQGVEVPPTPDPDAVVAAVAPSVPVEEPAPAPAQVNEEAPSAGGRTRKRPPAKQRRG